jgi:hypothetical protein
MDLGELGTIATTEDAGRMLPDYGSGWADAVAAGIDVTLIERNLGLAPWQRLERARAMDRQRERLQRRTVRPDVRAAIERGRMLEKLDALGVRPEEILDAGEV